MKDVEYRYELKYLISNEAAELLKIELGKVMKLDSHSISKDCSYLIRSLYFDNPYNTAYFDKIDGIEYRKKYRIRMYNNDPSIIHLECKHKDENMTYKESTSLSKEEVLKILNNSIFSIERRNEFLTRFLAEYNAQVLRPSVIVDYKRLAFTYPTSEVRITFDWDIRSGRHDYDFFNSNIPTFPLYPEGQTVLEVKCNEYIPEHILTVLKTVPKLRQAVSKFAFSRSI